MPKTGLDYFGARYYSSAQGRFTSPDVPLIAQRPGDPQSWNLYAYVRNNPLIYIDSTGHVLELAKNAGRGDRKNYNSAVNYVSRDSGASGILSTLRNSSSTYTVRSSTMETIDLTLGTIRSIGTPSQHWRL